MLKLVLSKLEMLRSSNGQLRQAPAGVDAGLVKLVLVADKKRCFKLAGRCQRLPYITATKYHYH